MEIAWFRHEDNWQEVKDAAMNTVGKDKGVYPTSAWKKKILLSEHSPIRRMNFAWRCASEPYSSRESVVAPSSITLKVGDESSVSFSLLVAVRNIS